MKVHNSITLERVEDAVRRQMCGTENPGFCIACGAEREGCEPDAEHYKCHECGERQVYGAQNVLFMIT